MQLPEAPRWQDRAACRGSDPKMWFPPDSPTAEIIAALVADEMYCRMCPVKVECLRSALVFGDVGIWAGTTTDLRMKLRRKRNRIKCPGCGNQKLIQASGFAVCLSCALSWPLGEDRDDDRRGLARTPG